MVEIIIQLLFLSCLFFMTAILYKIAQELKQLHLATKQCSWEIHAVEEGVRNKGTDLCRSQTNLNRDLIGIKIELDLINRKLK